MPKIVGVRFRKAGKIYYFDPCSRWYDADQKVIVETARGLEIGEVAIIAKNVPETELVLPLKKVLRPAGEADLLQHEENLSREAEALEKCQTLILRHGLEMKLVGVEYTFDRGKIIFYFTADGRVDFRELVKDLATVFRTRIELRQIGVRDEAKIRGGIGSCGRSFCCASFLDEFAPVSIRMAKGQNLSLNPNKISGVCGRLMCCLRFEMDTYAEARTVLPTKGDPVITPDGEGRVEEASARKKTVRVKLCEGGKIRQFPLEEVEQIGKG